MRPVFLAAMLSLALFAAAQTEPETIPALPAADFDVALHVKDASTLSGFPGKVIRLLFSSASETRTTVALLPNDSAARTSLDGGEWRIFGEIDDPQTPGSDYAGVLALPVSNSTSADLLLQQTGSLTGSVHDESNRSISGARLKLECVSSFHDAALLDDPSASDEYGAFSLRYVPAGTPCRLHAIYNGKLGAADFTLSKGELRNLRVTLTGEKASEENPLTPAMIFVLAVAILVILAYLLFFRKTKKPQTSAAQPQKHPAKTATPSPSSQQAILRTRKMRDVIATLPEGERRVVEHLLENNGRSRHSKIFYALLIPKTTLSRLLFSLENKNIVRTQKFGKIRQVELSEWFLSEK